MKKSHVVSEVSQRLTSESMVSFFCASKIETLVRCICGNKDPSRFIMNDHEGDLICKGIFYMLGVNSRLWDYCLCECFV